MQRDGVSRQRDRHHSPEKVMLFCPACKKSYVKRSALDRHTPKCVAAHAARNWKLKRAYPIYCEWFTSTKRSVPTYDTFVTSTFGSHFMKFVDWCDQMNVASVSVYVAVMVSEGFAPRDWSTVDAYKRYIERFDDVCTVDQWLSATVLTMYRLCEERQVPIQRFYATTPPNQLIHLIRIKSIYPRYLVCDPAFTAYLASLPTTVAKMISAAIPDRYLSPSLPCDPAILAIVDQVSK